MHIEAIVLEDAFGRCAAHARSTTGDHGFVLNDATKVMVVFGVCCDNCHADG